jgi:hypothetical protein
MSLTQNLLDRVAALLNRDATNYTVFLRLYEAPSRGCVDDLSACIHAIVGANAEIDTPDEIGVENVLFEMDDLLRYAGDPGSGPDDSILKSREFQDLLVELRNEVRGLATQSTDIKKIFFNKGHPAYPVFWDFAYVFFSDLTMSILIGSSSD